MGRLVTFPPHLEMVGITSFIHFSKLLLFYYFVVVYFNFIIIKKYTITSFVVLIIIITCDYFLLFLNFNIFLLYFF